MTHEEAIKDIKKIMEVKFSAASRPVALDMAIEALEKQIPRKPFGVACCPSCKNELPMKPIDASVKTYCMYCGQAIDWSDSDE